MRMKRKLLCAFALCFLSVSALADAPDETERLVVYTSHKEEVYQPIVEEFDGARAFGCRWFPAERRSCSNASQRKRKRPWPT